MSEAIKICGIQAEKGRWILVVAGMMIELCLGSIYAYSILSVPLMELFGRRGLQVSATAMQAPYMTLLVVTALTMPLVGQFIERFGPRRVSMIGGVLTGLGWFLASTARSPAELAVTYGIVGGLGVGLTFNCPITTSARWFPDKRGLAVGLTVLGFGFSAALTGPLSDYLTVNCGGIINTFRIFGVSFILIILLLSLPLTFPSKDWTPRGWRPPLISPDAQESVDLKREQMVRSPRFYGLWLCYAIGTLAGLMAVGVAKPMGLEVAKNAGMDDVMASALMTELIVPFALCNGLGRPIFGWLTDRLNPARAAVPSYILILFASLLMYSFPSSVLIYAVSFALLWLCLGSWEGITPAATAVYFGTKDYPRNYGLVCTAYGAGAVVGNVLVGQVRDLLGDYVSVFPIVAAMAVVGVILALMLMKPAESPHSLLPFNS
ncbi:MAG: L-lactate MFS transporter [Methanothrix sp.]